MVVTEGTMIKVWCSRKKAKHFQFMVTVFKNNSRCQPLKIKPFMWKPGGNPLKINGELVEKTHQKLRKGRAKETC